MKQVLAKIYTPSGLFIKTWTNVALGSFVKELDGGLGECVLDLGQAFDYSGTDLQLGNQVEILISDKQTVLTSEGYKRIYSGCISMVEGIVEGQKEHILVNLLGNYTRLGLDILKNNQTTTLFTDATNGLTTTSPGSAADLGKVMRAIIDRYRAENANPELSYSPTSIIDTATTALFLFEQKTYRDAIDRVRDMAPAGWFYYVDENGIVYFKNKPSTATHQFVFGKHFSQVHVQRSLEKVRNVLLIWNGEPGGDPNLVYKNYADTASIALCRRRAEKYVDYGINDTSSADKIAARFLAENRNPEAKVVCEIADDNGDPIKGYDIESINPGDTCRFVGFNETLSELFNDNMLITKVVYSLDKVELTVEAMKSGLLDWQEKTSKQVKDITSAGSPASYT